MKKSNNTAQNFETTISLSIEDYEKLMKDSLLLTSLYAVGVENWDRFKYAETLASGGDFGAVKED